MHYLMDGKRKEPEEIIIIIMMSLRVEGEEEITDWLDWIFFCKEQDDGNDDDGGDHDEHYLLSIVLASLNFEQKKADLTLQTENSLVTRRRIR